MNKHFQDYVLRIAAAANDLKAQFTVTQTGLYYMAEFTPFDKKMIAIGETEESARLSLLVKIRERSK